MRIAFPAWFVLSAATALLVTGLAKVRAGLGHAEVLVISDPITGVQFGYLLLGVGILELAIAGVCIFGQSRELKLGLIAWLATDIVVYRVGLWWIGWEEPCHCLGNLTDALHMSPHTADILIKVLLAYLLIGSCGVLIWEWRRGKATAKMEDGRSKIAVE